MPVVEEVIVGPSPQRHLHLHLHLLKPREEEEEEEEEEAAVNGGSKNKRKRLHFMLKLTEGIVQSFFSLSIQISLTTTFNGQIIVDAPTDKGQSLVTS
jgi:hypothetical protein